MRKSLLFLILPVSAAAYIGGCHTQDVDREPGPDLIEMVRKADFVFEGEVVRVEYKNSRPLPAALRKNTVIDRENDEVRARLINGQNRGLLADTGEVPHTFVTYRVLQPFKGDFANTTEVTLRFAGGVNTTEKVTRISPIDFSVEEINTITEIMQAPQIDVGDRDFVFAHRNGQKACPLVDCGIGRLRVLRAEGDAQDFVFDEWGKEVHQLEDGQGQARLHYLFERQIPEVNTHFVTFPNGAVRKFSIVSVEPDTIGDDSRPSSTTSEPLRHAIGPNAQDEVTAERPSAETRITPASLTQMLVTAVDQLYPGGTTDQPVLSVNIRDDFEISYFKGEITAIDRVENDRPTPTLPQTPCARIEAAVAAEASVDPATGGVREEADVTLTPDQIRRIRAVCDNESAAGEGE